MTEFHIFTLPNGIRCVLKRVRSAVTYCALSINTGSRDEQPGEHGVAHLCEHALFKGTARRRAHHINSRLENLGGELNAYTTKEETVIHTTSLKADFSKSAELIADIAFCSTFPAAEIEKEKQVILDEINSYKDSPAESIFDDFEELIFAGSQLGHNILGTKKEVKTLNRNKVESFVQRTYNTDRMVFSAIGNLSEAQFRRVAERWFGPVPASPGTSTRTAPEKVAPFDKRMAKPNHQAHCLLGTYAPGLCDPDRIPFALLANILGGPAANSLLNSSLREKSGLTYNVEAGYVPFADTGLATVYFGCEKENTAQCLELIRKEIHKLQTSPFTDRRLSLFKKQLLGQMAVSMEGNEGYMLGAAKSLLVFNRIEPIEETYARVQAIKPAEITDLANRVLTRFSSLTYE